MNVLITGITGFVGSHLVDYLLGMEGINVHGMTRWRSSKDNIQHCMDKVTLHYCDLSDYSSVFECFYTVRPEIVFHLAAQSYVPYSFKVPASTLEVNVIGTCNLLESIKTLKLQDGYDPVIHACSSSEVYGQVYEDEIPITEEQPFRPASPYAVSKVAEDMLGFQYWLSYKIKIIRTRMFTHSISYDSPVVVRSKDGSINFVPISDIRKARDKTSVEFWDGENINLEVWDGCQFTKILNISAHKLNGHKLLKLVTGKSIVDVTDNHSIYDADDNLVNAADMSTGDRLAVRDLPSDNPNISSISADFAWLLGFLVAEGSIKESRKICFSNADCDIINKTAQLSKTTWCKDSTVYKDKNAYTLNILDALELSKLFDDHNSVFGIYTKCRSKATGKRFKKIPQIILNSNIDTQSSFLEGYNIGDGRKNEKLRSKFQEFKTNSQCLASGLCFLVNRVTGQEHNLNVEKRELSNKEITYYYSIGFRSNSEDSRQLAGKHFRIEKNIIKQVDTVSEDKHEFVYDIETESHAFSCGIGSIKVHNTGPRRGEVFVVSNFAKQIAEIEIKGKEPVIHVGNLDSVRTFADVRDTVRAYWLLVQKCPPGEVYNIGGNATMTVGEMLRKLIDLSTNRDIKIKVDSDRLRPSDVTLQIPATDKFKLATGWEPEISFEQTLTDTLNYWRSTV